METNKGKSQGRAQSKSTSCCNLKDIARYNYGKKGHVKKYCQSLKKDKEKIWDKGKKKQYESNMKIEEINIVSGDSEEGVIVLNSGLELCIQGYPFM